MLPGFYESSGVRKATFGLYHERATQGITTVDRIGTRVQLDTRNGVTRNQVPVDLVRQRFVHPHAIDEHT